MSKIQIDIPKLIKMYQNFIPMSEIAKEFKCSTPTLRKCLKKCDVPIRDEQEVIKRQNLKKYGVEYPFQRKDVQNKIKQNVQNKYGVDNVAKLDFVKQKVVQTKLDKFGAINNSCTENWKQEHKNTCLSKFGAINNSCTEDWRHKTIQKNNIKYGCDWFTQTDEYLTLKSETNKSRYNVLDYNQQHIQNYDDWIHFDKWVENFLQHHDKITTGDVLEHFKVTCTEALQHIQQYELRDKFDIHTSYMETYFEQFLKQLNVHYIYTGIEHI